MCNFKLYAARDIKTGKLVSDIPSLRRKFWQRRDNCEKAIRNAKRWRPGYDLELVTLNVIEEVTPKE